MIRVEQLRKRYGKVRAVDGVSFEVRPGEVYGLLGPNGAGKTTTLSMLSGLLNPDAGRILFDGVDLSSDPRRIQQRLGVVPQETALYDQLTGRQNLRFWAGLYGLSGRQLERQVDQTLDRLGIREHVIELGYVADCDMPALYSGAELFLFATLWEGFGIPVLESKAPW